MIKNKSFTLIELLVVIVIIGILAGVIIVSTSSSISKASIAKVKVFENSIQNELGANMVSRWKLDEVIGTTTTPDAWGSNTGTLGDGVTASTYPTSKSESECVTGKCMSFDGTNDYINCGNDKSLNVQNNNFSISAWIKLNSKWGHIISKRESFGIAIPFQFYTTDSNAIGFSYYNTTSGWDANNGGASLKTNQWYFAVVSYYFEGNGISKIYVDGKEYYTKYHTFLTQNDLASKARMGSWSNTSELFNGSIDDVRIYSAALSASQIEQEYVAGLNSLLANNNILKEEYDQRLNNLAYDKE
ncbi:MAG: prepilin-type N-terminal cleavage/methylation domain-containing protein [Clostridia bacterium]|nr:prepilin-type N-terminal cleavage/methylation domain-containing protein [Clostridia bacterium]